MAWQVGVVLDIGARLGALPGWLPMWAWANSNNIADAEELRKMYGAIWFPEPALTLITTPQGEDPVSALIAEIPLIEEHHPGMTAVRVFTSDEPSRLTSRMEVLGYPFRKRKAQEWILFSKPMQNLMQVTEIELDAAAWQSSDVSTMPFSKQWEHQNGTVATSTL